jgi:hypothetical protein
MAGREVAPVDNFVEKCPSKSHQTAWRQAYVGEPTYRPAPRKALSNKASSDLLHRLSTIVNRNRLYRTAT